MRNLNELSREIYEANKAKGFWDKERNYGEMLMLAISELGEGINAHRSGRLSKIDEVDERDFVLSFEGLVKDTFEDEVADTFIRLMDIYGGSGIVGHDLDYSVWAEHRLAADNLRGIDNVGEGMLVVTHEICKCHTSRMRIPYAIAHIIQFCAFHGIDLDAHVTAKIRYNSTRPRLHGKKY